MRPFAVAAREIEGTRRGVGRWLLEVLREVRAAGRAGDFTLLVENGLDPGLGLDGFEVVATGPGPGGSATAWEQVAVPRALARDRPRVLLGPAYSLPVRLGAAGVVVLHDLSFESHPEWFSWREGTRRRTLARLAARRARLVVAVSGFGAGEIERHYGVPPERIRLVGEGVAARFRPETDPARLGEVRRFLGIDGDVVLAVGSLFTRRRPRDLVEGMAIVMRRRPATALVLVGDDRTWPPLDVRGLLRTAGIEERTVWLDSVPEELLVPLYSLARVFVYLSDYEGFGLPPLEALACGTPVVASRGSALEENLGGHASLLLAVTPETVAEAVLALLAAGPPARQRPAWLDRHSWREAASRLLAALDEAAR